MNMNITKQNIGKLVVENIWERFEDDMQMLKFASKVEDVDDLHDALLFVEIDGVKIEHDDKLYDEMCEVIDNLLDDEFETIKNQIEDGAECEDVNGEILRGYYSDLL